MSSNHQSAMPPQSARPTRSVILIGTLMLALLGAACGIQNSQNPGDTQTSPSPTASDTHIGTKSRILSMQVGDCFSYADMATTNNQYAWVVDCTQPHDTEVFATGAITDASYPTADGWSNWGAQICDPAFQPYVGVEWFDSELDIFKVYPDQVTWDNEPEIRQMVCLARDMSGILLTASVAGSNR